MDKGWFHAALVILFPIILSSHVFFKIAYEFTFSNFLQYKHTFLKTLDRLLSQYILCV